MFSGRMSILEIRVSPELGIELPVRKVGPEHDEKLAIVHGKIARGVSDQARQADVVKRVSLPREIL